MLRNLYAIILVFAFTGLVSNAQEADGLYGPFSGGPPLNAYDSAHLMSLPELLLIDELSLGLAPLVTKEIYAALDHLGDETTVLLVEQNVELALKHSGRAYIVESGRVTRTGASGDLMDDPDIRRAYLGM